MSRRGRSGAVRGEDVDRDADEVRRYVEERRGEVRRLVHGRIDEMSKKIDDLERSIDNLIKEGEGEAGEAKVDKP